jgi:Putative ATPase subunit of terminase (gpP-like)
MTCERHEAKKSKARELRWLGFSTPQIAKMLAVKSPRTISDWTEGIPNPEWTKRPRAKDDLRVVARRMRQEGRSYREIRAEVPVSKSTLSLWLKDVPISEEQRALLQQKRVAGGERRATALRARRIASERRIMDEAAAEIGELSTRELFIAGVILYWAEGSKQKPWRVRTSTVLINSDPTVIRLYMAWLQLLDIPIERLQATVSIHETADVSAAETYWSKVSGIPLKQFRKATLKRHKPRTNRKNTGAEYRGCLIIRVRRSTDLYRHIAGWYGGIVDAIGGSTRGKSPGFGPGNEGSNPSPPATDTSAGSIPFNPATLFEPSTPYLAARAS